MQNLTIKNKKSSGVTLVELVVVLAVISIIVSVTAGIFISFVNQQRKILAEQELLNQTSYTIEYIARSVRDAIKDTSGSCTGTVSNYYTLSHLDSTSGLYQGIKVLSKDNVCHEFFLDVDGSIKEIKNGQPSQPLLSNAFNIQYIRFIIDGNKSIASASASDTSQPRVSISLQVMSNINGQKEYKTIQTTISQDALNVTNL